MFVGTDKTALPFDICIGGNRYHTSSHRPRRRRFGSMFTPVLRVCGYKTSSGRPGWPSRDPLKEKGGFNVYAFVENDAINHDDKLGLMKYSEIQALQQKLDAEYSKKCCWSFCNTLRLTYDVNGYAVGSTVTGRATPHFEGCVKHVYYFWWTCYQAIREGGNQSREQGWEPGASSYSDTEQPNSFSTTTGINWPFDPFNLAMESSAIVIVCIHGQMHAVLIGGSDELDWTWNNNYQQWNDPPGKNIK